MDKEKIKNVLGKVIKLFKNKQLPQGKKLTPNEIELASYKERERLDNVKKQLAKYRKKNSDELLVGHKIETKASLMNSRYVFKDRKKKQPSLLNSGGSLW